MKSENIHEDLVAQTYLIFADDAGADPARHETTVDRFMALLGRSQRLVRRSKRMTGRRQAVKRTPRERDADR